MAQHVGEAVHVLLEVHDRQLVSTLYNWATVHKPKTINHEGLLLTRDRENCGSVRACICHYSRITIRTVPQPKSDTLVRQGMPVATVNQLNGNLLCGCGLRQEQREQCASNLQEWLGMPSRGHRGNTAYQQHFSSLYPTQDYGRLGTVRLGTVRNTCSRTRLQDGGRRLRPHGPRERLRGVPLRHSTDESIEQRRNLVGGE